MSRKQSLALNFFALMLFVWLVMMLAIGGAFVLARRPHDFGRLMFTGVDAANQSGVYFYNWDTGGRLPLPREKISDTIISWKMDDDHVYTQACLVMGSVVCSASVQQIFTHDYVPALDVLSFGWPTDHGSPIWSPDGQLIAFGSYSSRDMLLMDADGTHIRELIPNKNIDGYNFTWSPDSQNLAFTADFNRDLNLFNLPSGQVKTLTNLGFPVSRLAWSPDGRQLAFITIVKQTSDASEVYVENIDGTNPTKVSGSTLKHYSQLVWSPDSSRLALGALNGIYLVNRDGSDLHQITAIRPAGAVVWSPDSENLTFYTLSETRKRYLYTIDTDGHNLPVRLIANSTFDSSNSSPPALYWLSG